MAFSILETTSFCIIYGFGIPKELFCVITYVRSNNNNDELNCCGWKYGASIILDPMLWLRNYNIFKMHCTIAIWFYVKNSCQNFNLRFIIKCHPLLTLSQLILTHSNLHFLFQQFCLSLSCFCIRNLIDEFPTSN